MASRSLVSRARGLWWRLTHRRYRPAAPYTRRDVDRIRAGAEQLARLAGLDVDQAAQLAEDWTLAPTPEAPANVHLAAPLDLERRAPESMATDYEAARRGLGWVVIDRKATQGPGAS